MDSVFKLLPQKIRAPIQRFGNGLLNKITEIRLSSGKPAMVVFGQEDEPLKNNLNENITVVKEDINFVIRSATQSSMYLKEDEIKEGFISLADGGRIGVCGTVRYLNGEVASHGDITSVNIRVPREVKGCAERVVGELYAGGNIGSTIVVSAPNKGKTTLLRDAVRILSDEKRLRVGVVDERYELWGNGRFDLGIRSDVICGCKKAQGIMMLIRTMAPKTIVVDEISTREDFFAVSEAIRCGVPIIASMHGRITPSLKKRCQENGFENLVELGDDFGLYTITKGDNRL